MTLIIFKIAITRNKKIMLLFPAKLPVASISSTSIFPEYQGQIFKFY